MPDNKIHCLHIDQESCSDAAPELCSDAPVSLPNNLFNNIEHMLESARPSLLRFASTHGVTPDETADVVQETLLEAWRSLEHLNSPERFQVWLYGICRNMCRRWLETRQREQHNISSLLAEVGNAEHAFLEEFVDPLAPDPIEVLTQQDLATLLDRALGYLPDTTRSALELHYLAELPQKEVALRLGLTINALEVRLHRARRQLRQLLGTHLSADAREFGLVLDEDLQAGWRETRIWCMYCARHHWQGLWETFPEKQRASLRFRCPHCSPSMGIGSPEFHGDLAYTGKMEEIYGLRSFQVAWKRTIPASKVFWESVLQRKRCGDCGTRVEALLLGPHERIPPLPRWHGLTLFVACPRCDGYWSTLASSMTYSHSLVRDFMTRFPRWIVEPETFGTYSGQAAICGCFVDIVSSTRLRFFLDAQTLQVFAVFQE